MIWAWSRGPSGWLVAHWRWHQVPNASWFPSINIIHAAETSAIFSLVSSSVWSLDLYWGDDTLSKCCDLVALYIPQRLHHVSLWTHWQCMDEPTFKHSSLFSLPGRSSMCMSSCHSHRVLPTPTMQCDCSGISINKEEHLVGFKDRTGMVICRGVSLLVHWLRPWLVTRWTWLKAQF